MFRQDDGGKLPLYIAIACAVIAFPLMITGAVYSKYAADDPRTPMVNQYNTAVNNWENTEHAEYAAKYATSSKIPALSVTRGTDADSGSVSSTTGFQAIMIGDAIILPNDSHDDYLRHDSGHMFIAEFIGFHDSDRKSEVGEAVFVIGSGDTMETIRKNVYSCKVESVAHTEYYTDADGDRKSRTYYKYKGVPKFMTGFNLIESMNDAYSDSVSFGGASIHSCSDVTWSAGSTSGEFSQESAATSYCQGSGREPPSDLNFKITLRSPSDPYYVAGQIAGCERYFGMTAEESQAVADGCLISFAVFAAVAFVSFMVAIDWYAMFCPPQPPGVEEDPELELEPRQPFPWCCWREEPEEVFDTDIEKVVHDLSKAIEEGSAKDITQAILTNIPSIATPLGIVREDYIRNEVVDAYGEYIGADLKSDVAEKLTNKNKALSQLVNALLSDRFDFEAQTLHEAMKGFGTDEDALICILCTLDEEDIFALQSAYSSRYERSLEQAVISETSGKFKRVLLLAGCDSKAESYAKVCNSAIQGLGTDCRALIRLMVTCTHQTMVDTRNAYARLYDEDLVDAMSGEWAIGGDFKRMLCALAKKHPANIVDEPDYDADVQALADAMNGIGTDEAALIEILANKTDDQIEELKSRYQATTGEILKMQVKKETTGLFESEGFRNTLMGLLTQREQQIAEYLVEAFHWWSNDDWGLISMLVHRTPEEMKSIKEYYMQCHNKDLIQDIRKYCKGDYEKALVALVAPRERTIARGIKACISGWITSTNKAGLIALLTHKDRIMPKLRREFERETQGQNLQAFIKAQCSGQFEAALVALARYTPPKTAGNV